VIAHKTNSTETRRQGLQVEIDARSSSAQRNRLGQFATPNALAVEIARYIAHFLPKEHAGIRFADPAIGSGSFFSAALEVFGRERIASAVGIEIDPVFCDASRQLWSDTGLKVIQGDFTSIVGNGQSTLRSSSSPGPRRKNPPSVARPADDRC
jgi:type I restriction-modification system DNA methylase subunit